VRKNTVDQYEIRAFKLPKKNIIISFFVALIITQIPSSIQWYHLVQRKKETSKFVNKLQCFETKNDTLLYKNWCDIPYEKHIENPLKKFCTR